MEFCLFISICLWASSNAESFNVSEYLEKQSQNLDSLLEKVLPNSDTNPAETILGSYNSVRYQNSNVSIFRLFNRNFFFIDNEIFVGTLEEHLRMHPYGIFNREKSKFFKIIEYQKTAFMALSTDHKILFYVLNENRTTPNLVQTIAVPFSFDGIFFINEESLYFISSTRIDEVSGFVKFYKWLGSHFDEIEALNVPGAIKLGSFPYKNTEIVIVERNLEQLTTKKVYSLVFGFRQDAIQKLQQLDTEKPTQMNIFFHRNIPYVLVYEKMLTQKLYKWTGYEMVLVKTFKFNSKFDYSVVIYQNSMPLIVQARTDEIIIFQIRNNNISLHETIPFRTPFSAILDIKQVENERGNITFIAGLNESNIINIYAMYFAGLSEIETEDGTLRTCFNNLQQRVYDRRQKLNQVTDSLLGTTGDSDDSNNRKKRKTNDNLNVSDSDIEIKVNDVITRLNKIKPILTKNGNFSNQFVVNNKTIIKGNLKAKSISTNDIKFNTVNGKKWTPKLWLRYGQDQIINGEVKAKILKTKVLVTKGKAVTKLFQSFLQRNGHQNITGNAKINNLLATKIFSKKINNIVIDNIFKRNDTSTVKGIKSFGNISANRTKVGKINEKTPEAFLELIRIDSQQNTKYASHVTIEELKVETIDSITWSEFENSVFKIGKNETIFGNLTAQNISTSNLQAKNINGLNTDYLMTKSTEQIINSTITFKNVETTHIECGTINNVDIKNAVKIGQNATIKGPVIIESIEVLKDLHVNLNNKTSFLKRNGHVLGTQKSDLLQRYLGRVVINGNIYVDDLSVFLNTTLIMGEKKISIGIFEDYWNKNGNQTIPVPFEATNITVPFLYTKSLNKIPVDNFAINNNKTQIKGPLHFTSADIKGDAILSKNFTNRSFDLNTLASQGVRINGTRSSIKGKKIFSNGLIVNKLRTKNSHILESKNNSESKIFKKLVIEENLYSKVNADVINKINVSSYLQDLMFLNSSQNISKMRFQTVKAENLQVKMINGYNVSEYLIVLEKLLNAKKIKNINIKGNVTIGKVQNVQTINDHNINNLFSKNHSDDNLLEADVKFTGKVKIKNLQASVINNIDFPYITRRFFHNRANQTVDAKYTFHNLKIEKSLHAKHINEYFVENLIDISSKKPQKIEAPNGIKLKNILFDKFIKAKNILPCDIYKVVNKMRYPDSQEWNSVEILGNVTFLDESSSLYRIIEKTVKKNEKNTILAPITIKGHAVVKTAKLNDKINGLNISELIEDAVLIDSEEEQIITGHKIFKNQIYANSVTVTHNADIPIINNIYVPELYKRIIKQQDINNITIFGKKTFFEGLQTNNIFTKKISGIEPEQIVNLKNLSRVPKALFDNIDIKSNLNIKFINNHDFNYVLKNRLLRNVTRQITNAVYYFDNLEILGNIKTTAINNIDIKNIIFDIGKQKINSPKQFLQSLTMLGNVHVDHINGIDITEVYNNSVFGESHEMNGYIIALNSVKFDGNVTAQTINGYPIETLQQTINSTLGNQDMEKNILDMKEQVKLIIKSSLPKVKHMPSEFMYIQKSEELQLGIENSIDARVNKINDHTFIHILIEESHEKCFLPPGCKCPVQKVVEITPQLSVSSLLEKKPQRIYGYDDDIMTIHLFTNSISTDARCRVNQTRDLKEISTMTWSTKNTKYSSGTSSIAQIFLTGYISGAEFFTLNGVTYSIISQYYNPVTDSHDLDCLLMRFNDDKTRVVIIQKIPTRGAWLLHLLHTAQGIILVIGNLAKPSYTEIYRFSQQNEQFELLRSLPYGSSKAVGVVLGIDSLIILANKEARLQVLKYNSQWDNYYYYQMLALEEPVLGISVFYVGDFGISDAYICIVTENNFQIYSFQYTDGWKLESKGIIRGLQTLVPFEINSQTYFFAASTGESSLLRVVKHGIEEN